MEVVKGARYIYTITEPNIIGIMISISVFWGRVVFCVFACAIAAMTENLVELLEIFNKLAQRLKL